MASEVLFDAEKQMSDNQQEPASQGGLGCAAAFLMLIILMLFVWTIKRFEKMDKRIDALIERASKP